MKKYIILIPVYNDWQSVFKLIQNIDLQLNDEIVEILIVNDASTEKYEENLKGISKIKSVKIINLNNNGGHRRAIATGLKYCKDNLEFDCIIPMDGDGEDRPEELKKFFKKAKMNTDVVTAVRVKRSEGTLFKILYFFHKIITLVLSGKMVKFGNYSCLSKNAVNKLLSDGAIWLSFSGAVTKHFPNHDFIHSHRGPRYFGPSKMSLFKLIIHSLSISVVFKDTLFIKIGLLITGFAILAYYLSYYFLILCLFSWIFLILVVFLGAEDDLKKLESSSANIKSLDSLYSR